MWDEDKNVKENEAFLIFFFFLLAWLSLFFSYPGV